MAAGQAGFMRGNGHVDAELTTLASIAGETLVKQLTTAAWEKTQAAVVELWRRAHPERADALHAELAETRSEVLAARQAGDDQAEQDLIGEWRSRLRRLLSVDPEVAGELRRLFADELQRGPGIAMKATASNRGRVYQAGRDQHITEG
jgi:hypothetical protein